MSADESATFSVVGLVVGIGSGYAQFLSLRIHGWVVLIVVCSVLTIITAGVIILVKRVDRVSLRMALLFSILAAVIGGGAGYAIRGQSGDGNHGSATAFNSPGPGTGPALPSAADTSAASSTAVTAEPDPTAISSPAVSTRTPTTVPSPPGPKICMSFSEPAANAAPIKPGTDVHLAGRVRCLAAAHELWLMSRPPDPGAAYYIVKGDAVTRTNGDWAAISYKLGDRSDVGKSRTFFGVDADAACAAGLKVASEKTPRKVASLPPSCRRLNPSIVVRFQS